MKGSSEPTCSFTSTETPLSTEPIPLCKQLFFPGTTHRLTAINLVIRQYLYNKPQTYFTD